MGASVSLILDEHLVKLVLEGEVRFDDLIEAAARVIVMQADRACSKTLVVFDSVTLYLNAREICSLPIRLRHAGLPTDAPVAIVLGDTSHAGSFWLYESIAHDWGFQHRLFVDVEAATAWLRVCAAATVPSSETSLTANEGARARLLFTG